MPIDVSKKRGLGGNPRRYRWFEGQSHVKENTATNKVADAVGAVMRPDLNPARGLGGFVQIRFAMFFASQIKNDSLRALVVQFGFSPYTSNSPDTLVEPELPPVLFPRVPTYTLPLATVGTANLTAFPA